jgi:hypothetical protein
MARLRSAIAKSGCEDAPEWPVGAISVFGGIVGGRRCETDSVLRNVDYARIESARDTSLVRIAFSDFWQGFDTIDNAFFHAIQDFEPLIVPAEEADYLFFSCFGGKHHAAARDDAVKIFYTAENVSPDFNGCDYAIGFDHIEFGDRHLRLPLYVLAAKDDRLHQRAPATDHDLKRPRFCNFVYSQSQADPRRDGFFHALNSVRPVVSAGRHLRNSESVDADVTISDAGTRKRNFMRNFRFTIAFENSTHPGYATEKIVDAFAARTIPIYWGDPRIGEEFDTRSFINVHDFADIDAVIAEVLRIDADEDARRVMLDADVYLGGEDKVAVYAEKLRVFLKAIFDQDRHQARRRAAAGFARKLERQRRKDETRFLRRLTRNRI